MFLATEALGLGGWKHCGFLSLEILERMGFRIVAANGAATFGNPVGIDGVFEASCRPYHPTMDAAVDAVLAPPSRGPTETGPVPHRMSEAEHRAGTIRISTDLPDRPDMQFNDLLSERPVEAQRERRHLRVARGVGHRSWLYRNLPRGATRHSQPRARLAFSQPAKRRT
jgi:hypothetical protein